MSRYDDFELSEADHVRIALVGLLSACRAEPKKSDAMEKAIKKAEGFLRGKEKSK
jgi:hypothetical protein